MKLIDYVSKIENKSNFDARGIILLGDVEVNGNSTTNINYVLNEEDKVVINNKREKRFVTRSGLKLERALNEFKIDVRDKVCLDCGASEGGFTDCLIKGGANKVYAVDVAYGILNWNLRTNSKVIVLERTNARYVNSDKVKDVIDILTVDVSFISAEKIVSNVSKFLNKNGVMVILFKPQFELPKVKLGKNGTVLNYLDCIEEISEFIYKISLLGINIDRIVESPIKGNHGNVEFLLGAIGNGLLERNKIDDVVKNAYERA